MQSKRVEQPIKSKIVTTVDIVMTEATVLPMAKFATGVAIKITLLKKCKQTDKDSRSCNRPRSKGDCDKCKSCGKSKKEFNSIEIDSDDCDGCNAVNKMEDLTEQVQSLFYH